MIVLLGKRDQAKRNYPIVKITARISGHHSIRVSITPQWMLITCLTVQTMANPLATHKIINHAKAKGNGSHCRCVRGKTSNFHLKLLTKSEFIFLLFDNLLNILQPASYRLSRLIELCASSRTSKWLEYENPATDVYFRWNNNIEHTKYAYYLQENDDFLGFLFDFLELDLRKKNHEFYD